MSDRKQTDDEVLERNVEQLLTRAHEPPRISDDARVRILETLKAERRDRAMQNAESRGSSTGVWGWLRARPASVAAVAVAATVAVVWTSANYLAGSRGPTAYSNQGPVPVRKVLDDGTALVLNQNAEVEVLGTRHLRVERGEVLLDVAKGSERFLVEAPHGRAVVLGTRFVISAGAAETCPPDCTSASNRCPG